MLIVVSSWDWTVPPDVTGGMLSSGLVLRMLSLLLTVTASHICPGMGVGQLSI